MKRSQLNPLRFPLGFALTGLATLAAYSVLVTGQPAQSDTMSPDQELVAHGKYLVAIMDCGGCHSPHDKQGKEIPGLELTGHPKGAPLPKWDSSLLERNILAGLSPTMTAFAGPFGISVADNLTPDLETGIGKMTAEDLIRGLKTGRHWKQDRSVLPPMPVYREMKDEDIRAMYAYLMSLKPVRNSLTTTAPVQAPSEPVEKVRKRGILMPWGNTSPPLAPLSWQKRGELEGAVPSGLPLSLRERGPGGEVCQGSPDFFNTLSEQKQKTDKKS